MSLLLFIHILGGIASFTAITSSLFTVITKKDSVHFTSIFLQSTTVFQIISGILLILFEHNVSTASVCIKGMGYVIISFAMQYLLQWRFTAQTRE